MTSVWSGSIELPNGATIRNVGFSTRHNSPAISLPARPLRYLSTVDTARIPLYFAAGPSLDVWTTSETTEDWFASLLLATYTSDTPKSWWTLARAQSPIGILVQVEQLATHTQSDASVTEVLIYGTLEPQSGTGLPTPPASSPQSLEDAVNQLPALQVHALPLCSSRVNQRGTIDKHSASRMLDGVESVGEPEFLPPYDRGLSMPDSPKRKRDIFEEADTARRKLKGKGGLGISAAAARTADIYRGSDGSVSVPGHLHITSATASRPQPANAALSRPCSRSSSHSRQASLDKQSLGPGSFGAAPSQPSQLSHVATSSLLPEELSTESRNKEALSKVVMAAMRMHGLQQSKKQKLRRASTMTSTNDVQSTSAADLEEAKDLEYKLIYHQTFKSVALAFRKHMPTEPLHSRQDQLRQVVEKFLMLFLTDPLIPLDQVENIDPTATPDVRHSRADVKNVASPFDLPSARRPGLGRSKTDSVVYTGSPMSKRIVDTGQVGQTGTTST